MKTGFTISFYDWCIKNNRLHFLEQWDYNLNVLHPKDIGFGSCNKIYFKCLTNKKHNSRLLKLSSHNLKKIICNECKECKQTFYDWCMNNDRENILDLWDSEKNKITPYDILSNSKEKFYFKCKNNINHNSKKYQISYIVNNNIYEFRCIKCDSFYEWCVQNNKINILNMWDYKLNKKSPNEVFKNTTKKYWFKCIKNIKHNSKQYSIMIITRNGNTPICEECNTFYSWCVYNNRTDLLDRWDYEKNKNDPKEIFYRSNEYYYFKCPQLKHESQLFLLSNLNKERKFKCNECNSMAEYLISLYGDNALNMYWDYNKNKNDPYKIPMHSENFIWIKCQEHDYHGSYKISNSNFTKGRRCPYCSGHKLHRFDSLGYSHPEVFAIWSSKNKKSPYDYSCGSQYKVFWKCENAIHDDYTRIIGSAFTLNYSCPECARKKTESHLEEKVRLFLSDELKYNINHEYKCSIVPINPKTKYPLPFDNEVVDLKLIIEVHGQQHYEVCGFHILQAKLNDTTPELEFKYQKWKDDFKKEYAISQGYHYLEIPYTSIDNNKYMNIINSKINKIKDEELNSSFLFY